MRGLSTCSLGLLALLGLFGLGKAQDQHVAPTPPRTPEEERATFKVPPGFEVQLVAAEPVIRKPMNLAFDARGRLWVTDTIEYPFPAKEGLGRDSIKVLEHFDETGRARKVTTFADGLNIPIGILPISQGALVFGIPHLYRLTDTDGDGKADRRNALFGPFGQEDTHGLVNGLTWGFDGWVYAAHGFRNTSTVKGFRGAAITLNSGNVFRFRPDGSRIEQYTWGQVNPFGLAFDPLGNLYSADCHSRPLMMLLRGGYYQSFGKPHDGLGFAPEICGHSHNSTAIAGIAYYAADHFPPSFRDTLFVGNVVTNRINHDRLDRHGSTYRAAEQPDFLVSTDPWFRPVDIKLGPDGALYVADFYNRIIGHYEVPLTHPGRDHERGRIWRIIYRGPEGKHTPPAMPADLTTAGPGRLAEALAHPNLVVRMLATNRLAELGSAAVEVCREVLANRNLTPTPRVHALWALDRLDALDEARLLAVEMTEPELNVHLLRILAERPTLSAALRQRAVASLGHPNAFVQRAAAESLGRHPAPEQIRPLLDLRHGISRHDSQLLHATRMALRDQLRPAASWASLPNLASGDGQALADVAVGVPSAEAARFLAEHLRPLESWSDDVQRFLHHIARHGNRDVVAEAIYVARRKRQEDPVFQASLVQALHRGTQERGGSFPPDALAWAGELVDRLLASPESRQTQAGVDLVGQLRLEGKRPHLMALANDRSKTDAHRGAALSALVAIGPREQVGLLGQLLAEATESIGFRERAVQLLAGIHMPEARTELVRHFPTVPARMQHALALGLSGNREGAELLLKTVAAGKASARLLQEPSVVKRLQAAKLPNLHERLSSLTKGLPPADQRLQELFRQRQTGFLAARTLEATGQQIFDKHCAACHQLEGRGAKVGPQLDGIGERGLERLLEDLLDPNRNVDEAFRTTTLALKNGQLLTGLFLREEGEVLVLADQQGKETRVAKNMVEERGLSPLSPMPGNWVDQIPEADFYHLLKFLLSQRTKGSR